ncbi:hypothetical protein [Listeria aquatica]|uniref:Uncharacterized protein n=1 Tax=Listeria aquatica FSL S10-1188 TaxID=1265818 RepID=W7BA43_9LIST|nr:hypothetical protein [Listeria aquatica]EUJ21565.1 hypothetical protein MAQA_02537 [Listeria aquatica FSL S10-1188]
MWTGVGRIFGVGSKLRMGMKVYRKKSIKPIYSTAKKNYKRLVKKPKKQLSRSPGKRSEKILKKIKKNEND